MSIRIKIILITALAVIIMVIAETVIANLVFLKQFDAFDKDQVQSEINLIVSQLNHNYEEMTRILWDKAAEEEIERYIKGENPDYWLLNWDIEDFQRLNLDAVIFMDLNGNIIQEGYLEPKSNEIKRLPNDFRALFSPGSEILDFIMDGRRIHGMMDIQEGTINLSSIQITGRSGGKTNYGYLIFGRWINADLIRSYGIEAGDTLEKYPIDQSPPEFKVILATLPVGVRSYVQIFNDKQIAGYLILMDPMGRPEVLLRFFSEREFFIRGLQGVNFIVTSTIMIGMILLIVYGASLEGYVIRPLTRLREELVPREKKPANGKGREIRWSDDISGLREPIQNALDKAQNAEIRGQRMQSLFSSLVDQANEGFALFDFDSLLIIEANPSYHLLTGFSKEPGSQRTLFGLFKEAGLALHREIFRSALNDLTKGKELRAEHSFKSGGKVREVEISASVIETGSGKNVFVLVRDITEKKQLEQELEIRLRETLLLNRVIAATSTTFENDKVFEMICRELALALKLPQTGIALVDKKSQAARMIAEYCAPEVPPSKGILIPFQADPSIKKLFESKHPIFIADAQRDPLTVATFKRVIERHTISAMVFPLIVQNETAGLLALESLKPRIFTSREKALAGNVATAISQSLEINLLYKNLQNELDKRKETEEALKVARDAALDASQAKSKFLATMSHEIRTPLNAVIGMTELLLDTPLNPEQQEYSYIAQDSAQVLLALMNDILDFSKIEAGKISLESIAFDLANVVESAVDLFVVRAQQKGLELFVHISPRIPHILTGDPIRLKQVLLNLVSNAVKFTERGEILINADMVSRKGKQVQLCFTIRDTGIGITQKAQKQLFKAFVQADGSMSRKYGGTGLGLEISRRLVELMGGKISVASKSQEGSEFRFTVWLGVEELEKQTGDVRTWQELAGTSIIVFSESANQMTILKSYLRDRNIKSVYCSTLNSTITRLLKTNYLSSKTYLIVDIPFEGVKGLEFARQLFTEKIIKPENIIVLVPMIRRDLVDAANKVGIGGVILKPIKVDSLSTGLSEVIIGRKFIADQKTIGKEKTVKIPGKQATPSTQDINVPLVLLAEDNAANAMVATAQLQKLGCRIEIATNGRDAVNIFTRYPSRYQLVLMDCQMPEMDGYAAVQVIREFESTRSSHVPVIAMTAHVSPEDKRECLDAGMDDYIGKPVRLNDLKRILSRWIPSQLSEDSVISNRVTKGLEKSVTLDEEVLSSLRNLQGEDKKNFLNELFTLFLNGSKQDIAIIDKGLNAGDAERIRKAAHALKGSSATLGGTSFSEICRQVEHLAIQNELEAIRRIQPEMIRRYRELVKVLRMEMKKENL
jgi:PAS domain S-box-containing protein